MSRPFVRDELRGLVTLDEKIALWGGVECTHNRVGDRYFDQMRWTGHATRVGDLQRFADLGLRTLRFPVLWENVAPHGVENADWGETDERLGQMRALGMDPVVGLIHHGSGPLHTSLLDPAFPARLAEFGRAVAERYPWLSSFTPVNEPITTARFGGLYGHWYPHRRDDAAFVRMVIHQCQAVVLTMRAIRESIPGARLVHIDDGGHTYGTPPLADQVEFENHRRWLGFDLLDGRVTPAHPLWPYLLSSGASATELEEFLRHPCRPDIVGLNYYLTSDRFLDHRLDRYSPSTWGGNGRMRYADLDAVRVRVEGIFGHCALLLEAWHRYRLPVALTEVHLGCSREEQLRWLVEAWRAAHQAKRAGADVRAVTAWALLGSMDWDSLVTRPAGHYEPGAFDVRAPSPRRTAVGSALQVLAAQRPYRNAVLQTPGWWRRSTRFLGGAQPFASSSSIDSPSPAAPLLICGANGTLGGAFARACARRGLDYRLLDRFGVDITRPESVRSALERLRPWGVINAAGYVRVDDGEHDIDRCFRENAAGPAILADQCSRYAARLLTFSSDLVFDGMKHSPYVETDPVGPLSAYGRAKAESEQRVLATMPTAMVVRTSAFFGPWDEHNFVTTTVNALRSGSVLVAMADGWVSPTYVPDLAETALDLLIDGESGIWHLANRGSITWAELAQRTASLAGLNGALIRPCPSSAMKLAAPRPSYSVLGSERSSIMPTLEDGLARYFVDRAVFLKEASSARWSASGGAR